MRKRTILLIPVVTALLYACGDESTGGTGGGGASAYEDVVYEGEITDEALDAFVSAMEQGVKDEPSKAPTLDAPTDGAALPKSTIPTFQWHVGATASHLAPASPSRFASWPASELVTPTINEAPLHRFLAPLGELIGPMRSARAHGTPFTGNATFLVFSTSSDPKLLRVFTGATAYTPSQAAWDKLAGAGAEITLTLTGAILEQNRIAMDGGPFKGSVSKFTITE